MPAPLNTLSRRTFLALSSAAAGTCALPGFATTTSTQKSTGALPTFSPAKFLDAADLTALTGDEQCLLVSLEGQMNRKQPRLYFYWGTDSTNQRWLNTITVPHQISTDPWEFLPKYRSEIRGAVVYDVNVPDTVNVATAIASMRGGVIATAALAKAHQLNVIQDLTGQFANGMAAYQWAFDNVWPHMPNRILTAISPTNSVQVANVQWTTLLQVTQPVTDSSNEAVYTADLTPFLTSSGAVYVRWQDAYTNDGWGPAVDQVTVTADGSVIASFQPGSAGEAPYAFDLDSSQTASGWRFADGTEYFIYNFVPPAGTKKLTLSTEMWNEYLVSATGTAPSVQQGNPNFRDYIVAAQAPVFWLDPEDATQAALFTSILERAQPDTPYLGWFPQGHEMTGVTLCGQHASPVVAADFYINGSVFAGGAHAPISSHITHPPVPKVQNKIYLTLTMVEGDNAQYNQHRMRDMWDDAGRGAVPLNWSISVLLYDLGPAILGYYQRTATANDLLMAGPSGAGYTYPAVWPAAALEAYTQRQRGVHAGHRHGYAVCVQPERLDRSALYSLDHRPLRAQCSWAAGDRLQLRVFEPGELHRRHAAGDAAGGERPGKRPDGAGASRGSMERHRSALCGGGLGVVEHDADGCEESGGLARRAVPGGARRHVLPVAACDTDEDVAPSLTASARRPNLLSA